MEVKNGNLNYKQIKEAETINLKLLSRSTNLNYNYYKFVECGHCAFLQPTHVRRNHIRCFDCQQIALKEKIKTLGLEQLDNTSDNEILVLKNLTCGHTFSATTQNLMRRSLGVELFCETCYELKLKNEASAANLTYLGKSSKKGLFRRYKFNSCGHEKDINATCITRGAFECKDCKIENHVELCKGHGLSLVDKSVEISTRLGTYILPCGHSKQIRTDHAEDGSYVCHICQDSFYTKQSSVYLLKIIALENNFSWLKLGFARNLDVRKSNYGLSSDCKIELLKNVESGGLALKYEKSIHKKFKERRIDFETMKNYHKRNGYTECYPVECERLLLEQLEEIAGGNCG